MTLIKRLGIVSLILLLTASIVVDVGYICYSIFNKDFSMGINNVGDQDAVDAEPLDPKEEDDPRNHEWFIEAQYYSNENNNGIELQEMKFNSFSAPTLLSADRKRYVMQYLGNVENLYNATQKRIWDYSYIDDPDNNFLGESTKKNLDKFQNHKSPAFNYYSATNDDLMADWRGMGTELTRNTQMMVKIGGEAYMIVLDGCMVSRYTYKSSIPLIRYFSGRVPVYAHYMYGLVFSDIMNGIDTNSIGEGTFYTTIDLSKYFTVTHHYNTESKRWEDVENDADQIFTYSAIKFTYSKDGAVSSKESLAHVINGDPSWSMAKYDYNTDYWQERVKCTLTDKDLAYRYSETLGGYLVSMPLAMKNDFKDMPKLEVTIDLNLNDQYLTSRKINLVGLDYNAFENLRLNTLIIRGNSNFTCLDNSLNNTYLTTLKRSSGLTLTMQDAISSDYVEVIL